jgi:splicing factor 3B subunit 2
MAKTEEEDISELKPDIAAKEEENVSEPKPDFAPATENDLIKPKPDVVAVSTEDVIEPKPDAAAATMDDAAEQKPDVTPRTSGRICSNRGSAARAAAEEGDLSGSKPLVSTAAEDDAIEPKSDVAPRPSSRRRSTRGPAARSVSYEGDVSASKPRGAAAAEKDSSEPDPDAASSEEDVVEPNPGAITDAVEVTLAKAKEDALAALSGVTSLLDEENAATERDGSKKAKRTVAKRPRVPDRQSSHDTDPIISNGSPPGASDSTLDGGRDAEYVPAELKIPEGFGELSAAIARFAATGQPVPDDDGSGEGNAQDPLKSGALDAPAVSADKTAGSDDDPENAGEKKAQQQPLSLSERQLRRRKRLSVAQLKALVRDPAVVEQWDVTASDPLLLVHLKAFPGSVTVPANWRQKRKYLQSKRGMEKLPFKMPQFIEDTGVGAARTALAEADAAKTAKQKGRERIRPKAAGKGVDVDFSVLRDAFFKFQTKPRLTAHGDLYYELREREVQHERFRPGALSASLREALGISNNDPPPWLIAMQRYGPPPSYPDLEIPGLNAPIPAGASFGYHPGGWGKPPVDASGQPLYGDVFGEGTKYGVEDSRFDLSSAEKERLWGELKPLGVVDEEEDPRAAAARKRHVYAEEADAEATPEKSEAAKKPASKPGDAAEVAPAAAGAAGLTGVASVTPGMETPAQGIELRKGLAPEQLYKVLEQKPASVGKAGIMGSSHVYNLGDGAADGTESAGGRATADTSGEMLLKKKRKDRDVDRKEEEREAKKAREARESAKAKEFKF